MIAILAVVGLVAAAGIVIFVMTSGEDESAAPPPTTTTTTTSKPKPKPKPKVKSGQYPRALAVKIDNVAASRPHTGLASANLIFVEPVEGGLTRMMAVYWGKRPGTIGPVRSARETDIGLLAQIKRPVLSFSGAASQLKPSLDRSNIVLASPDHSGGYSRNFSRPNPHNMFVAPNSLPNTKAVDSPLNFGKAPAGGKAVTSESVYYQGASYGFEWARKGGVWKISMGGSPLVSTESGQLRASTVVVQRVNIVTGVGIRDAAGNSSPVVKSVGKGAVTVLRDGKAYRGTWSREKPNRRTLYKTSDGKPLPMAQGQVWVMLVPG